jgi:hypothetical protein
MAPITEVCSPVNSMKKGAPMPGNRGLPTSPGAFSNPGNARRSDQKTVSRPDRDLSDPDPFPSQSRSTSDKR